MAADAGTAASGSPSRLAPLSCGLSPSNGNQPMANNDGSNTGSNKRKRRPAGTPDPDAEVVSLSPRTLLESDRYICDICSQGFQRDQNLQMHRRRHKVPWKLLKKATTDTRKRVYVCPETTCLHHDPSHALGDLVGIKKHYRRKHSTDKQWKCEKCSKGYAVQSDYKAHLKTCGTRGHCCDCGRVFSRVESFIEHQDTCTAAKEKTALPIAQGGGNQHNQCLADSPTSRSLSTDCISVDLSRSAISDSVIMPNSRDFELEYGEIPVNSSSSRSGSGGGQQQWMMIGNSRELQLLPEGEKGRSMIVHLMSTATNDRRAVPVNSRNTPSPSAENGDGCAARIRSRDAGEFEESTPRLQLSIGSYSVTEDVPNLMERPSVSMIDPSLPDIYEVKPITVNERAAVSSRQHQRPQRRSSDRSTTDHEVVSEGLGALQSLFDASPALVRGAGGESSSNRGNDDACEEIGGCLRLTSLPPPTASGCAGVDPPRVVQKYHLLNESLPWRNVSNNLLSVTVKECSPLSSSRRSRSPNQHRQFNIINTQSDVVVVPTSSDCMGIGSWELAYRHHISTPLNPTTCTTSITNGGIRGYLSETPAMPSRSQKHGEGRSRTQEHNEAALRALESSSGDNEMANNASELTRTDAGSAWSDLAVARRTKEQARVELEEAESQLAQAELLKQEAREQMKLASAEKTYADHARENAKRQRELAESELNSAKRARERAQSEIAKAQMLKEQANRFADIASRGSRPFPVAGAITNYPGSDANSTAQNIQQHREQLNNDNFNINHSQRQVPLSLDFTSLPLPSFSSTLSPFQVSTQLHFSSSVIPSTFIGTSAVYPPPLPPSLDTIRSTTASLLSSMVTESHDQLRTPKPEMT